MVVFYALMMISVRIIWNLGKFICFGISSAEVIVDYKLRCRSSNNSGMDGCDVCVYVCNMWDKLGIYPACALVVVLDEWQAGRQGE